MKLLNRSIRSYIAYSVIIIIIAVPVIYFAIQHIVYEEVDESLVAQKEEVVQHFEKIPPHAFEPASKEAGIQLIPATQLLKQDSFYNITIYDKISKEHIPYRVVETGVILNNKTYTLQLRRSLIDNEDIIQSIVTVMIILILLIVTGFLIINRVLSKKIWKPFYRTVSTLNDYDLAKNEMPQFEKTKVDEFNDLNNSIAALIKRNQSVFQSQKEFTENAAHEMQTPLAILQGKIELLMQTEPLNTEQAELINDLAGANERINRLNRSLLLLTKIENNQFIEKEQILLSDTVKKILDQYAYLAEQKNISFEKHSAKEITVESNRTLLEILISNLITNAVRHSPDRGKVIVGGIGKGEFIIKNTAKNGPLDDSRIFKRFEKVSSDDNSTGLGLAIVSKICSIYQYDIEYSYAGDMHVFSVKF